MPSSISFTSINHIAWFTESYFHKMEHFVSRSQNWENLRKYTRKSLLWKVTLERHFPLYVKCTGKCFFKLNPKSLYLCPCAEFSWSGGVCGVSSVLGWHDHLVWKVADFILDLRVRHTQPQVRPLWCKMPITSTFWYNWTFMFEHFGLKLPILGQNLKFLRTNGVSFKN